MKYRVTAIVETDRPLTKSDGFLLCTTQPTNMKRKIATATSVNLKYKAMPAKPTDDGGK